MADVLGVFEQAVLLAILRLKDDAYGRAILKDVETRLDRPVIAGALYTTLDRLEAKGLTSSQLGSGTPQRAGRPRRFYVLEGPGLRALKDSRTAIHSIWHGVPQSLKGRA